MALISIVTTTDVDKLHQHIDAIQSQLRAPDEHLWLCSAEQATELRETLGDETRSTSPQVVTSISELPNQANADFLWLVPTDAEPTPPAVETIIFDIHVYGPASLIFGDDYFTQRGREPQPIFRPNFSPLTRTSQEPIGRHPIIKRSDLARITAGFTPGEEASSLALNCCDLGLRVRQLPSLLAHFRDTDPPLVSSEHQGNEGEPSDHDGTELISIIIPSAGFPSKTSGRPAILDLADSLAKTLDERTEVIVVCDEGFDTNLADQLRDLLLVQPRFIKHDRQGRGFNFARMVNQGAHCASGDILVFLNDDITNLSTRWLSVIRQHFNQGKTSVLGAWITEPNGDLWHCGITTQPSDGGLPIHGGQLSSPKSLDPIFGQFRQVLAVTGALTVVYRDVYWNVGGLSSQFPSDYNDVDLCLKARQIDVGSQTSIRLRATHDEGTSRGRNRNMEAEELIQGRWRHELASDPWRNPNIAHETLKPMPDWRHWERQRPVAQTAHSAISTKGDSRGYLEWASIRAAHLLQPRRCSLPMSPNQDR